MHLTYAEEELLQTAEWVIENAPSKILCLHGQMGAGKTTLIKALLQVLCASDAGSSPTFGLVNEYRLKNGDLLGYHFDFYRLNDELEAYDMGFEEYLGQDCWIFIEWPEKIPSLVPADATAIHIDIIDATAREIRIRN